MADFCTQADVEALLQVSISTPAQIASCARAIAEATEAIRNYCDQYIELVANDVYTFDVPTLRYNLFLPELPVVSIASVVEDGETLTVTDDYKLANDGVLVRVGGRWPIGIQIVQVTYTHGYATIPDDIVAVCTRAAARGYQAGLKAADSAGIAGIASKSLGDFAVGFQAEQGGGSGEGVMGVSAARMLLMSEKDMLNKYRLKGL